MFGLPNPFDNEGAFHIPDSVEIGKDENGNPITLEPKTLIKDGIVFALIGILVKKTIDVANDWIDE